MHVYRKSTLNKHGCNGMMNANDMAMYILQQMQGIMDANQANQRYGQAVSDYIKNNAELLFSWTAALPDPPYTPDPVTQATGKIIQLNIIMQPSYATTVAAAQNYMRNQFIAGMTLAMYNITQPGWTTTPASMSSSLNLNNLTIAPAGSTAMDVHVSVCTQIINWVKQLAPTAPCAGTHGSYVGSGTVIAIS